MGTGGFLKYPFERSMWRITMKMKCLVSTLQVLVFNLLMITLVMSVGAEPPQVISTNPPNGVVGVRPDLDAVYIIFDKPMNWPNVTPENKCVTISKNIRGGALVQWEDNIFHLYRGDPETDLPFGTEVRLTLNPPGSAEDCFRDTEGNRLSTYVLTFAVRQNPDDPPIEPRVVATDPPNGSTGVDPNISSVSITFDKPMAETSSHLGWLLLSHGWGPSTRSWSDDKKTFTYTRNDAGTPLYAGTTSVFVLNPDLYTRFQDTEGNALGETSYSFTVQGDQETFNENFYDLEITRVPANPDKGFYWPYYLSVPNVLSDPTLLFVVPNNSGYDAYDHILHDVNAREELYWQAGNIHNWGLNTPILIPTFPRYPGQYFQSLGPVAFQKHDDEALQRIDLQLMAMIEDARERLRSAGHHVYKKVFMAGFSASASFTGMFTIVHPEIIQACAQGGGLPTVLRRDGTVWKFNAAGKVWDLEKLTKTPFNLKAYRKASQYIYIGDQDGNYTEKSWEDATAAYEAMKLSAQFEIYPDVGHWYSSEMLTDLGTFFNENKAPTDVYLFSPSGGENLQAGAVHRIVWWAPASATKFKLLYSVDNGATWRPIPETQDFITTTYYDWNVPPEAKNRNACLVSVVAFDQYDGKVGTAKSEKPFTIEVVKLTAPDGGTIASGPYSIAWEIYETIKPVTWIQLSYTLSGGRTWIPLRTLPEGLYLPGTYEELWDVPSVTRKNCRVKVVLKDANGKNIGADASDSTFAIQPAP